MSSSSIQGEALHCGESVGFESLVHSSDAPIGAGILRSTIARVRIWVSTPCDRMSDPQTHKTIDVTPSLGETAISALPRTCRAQSDSRLRLVPQREGQESQVQSWSFLWRIHQNIRNGKLKGSRRSVAAQRRVRWRKEIPGRWHRAGL